MVYQTGEKTKKKRKDTGGGGGGGGKGRDSFVEHIPLPLSHLSHCLRYLHRHTNERNHKKPAKAGIISSENHSLLSHPLRISHSLPPPSRLLSPLSLSYSNYIGTLMKEATNKPAKAGIISSEELIQHIGIPPRQTIPTKNGGIECVISTFNIE
jgi:hypothetical protein